MLRSALLFAIVASGFGTTTDNDWPPARFQSTGTVIVTVAGTQQVINIWCGKAPKGYYTEACSTEDRIVLPNPCNFPHWEQFARIACHEMAHQRGNWPGNHPA